MANVSSAVGEWLCGGWRFRRTPIGVEVTADRSDPPGRGICLAWSDWNDIVSTMDRADARPVRDGDHLWIAYYGDWSAFAVFRSEIECLRYAVEHSMTASRCPVGESIREALRD